VKTLSENAAPAALPLSQTMFTLSLKDGFILCGHIQRHISLNS
jgi:hypothetical protein